MNLRVITLALVASVVIGATAQAALPKPKPWQWTPTKVVTRITALKPITAREFGTDILSASCASRGKGVAGRYSRFSCTTRWGNSNGSYTSILTIRILPVGSGKLCVVTTTNNSGEVVAVPHKPNTQGTRIKPELACPA